MVSIQTLILGWTKIASGNAAAGLLRLLAFAIMAWAIDVTAVGIIALIDAYARTVDGLLNFQSVNVLTKFLTEAEHRNESQRFCALVKAGLLIDSVTALAAAAVAVATIPFIGPVLGITEEWIGPAMVFCLIIACRVLGTAEAVLRCYDRFWAIGIRDAIASALMVVLAIAAWWASRGPVTFLIIGLVAEMAANALFLAWSFRVLREFGHTEIWSHDARDAIRSAPGFWRLLWHTNITFGIRMLSLQGDVLVAGAVIGPQAAALLRAAKNVAALLSQFGRPLQQVVSAPIARLWLDGKTKEILVYTRKVCLLAASSGLVLTILSALFGSGALMLMFGPDFVAAAVALTLMVLANTINLAGVTLLPTMITLNISAGFFHAILLGTLAYSIVLVALVSPFGVGGIAIAHIALNITWAVYGWNNVIQRIRASRRDESLQSAQSLLAKKP